jgi:hypothetical protein
MAVEAPETGLPELVPEVSWTLPEPAYQIVGEIVILQSVLQSQPLTAAETSETETQPPKTVRAVKVTSHEFGNLLFCDLSVHKRKAYLKRLEMFQSWHDWKGRSFASATDAHHTEMHHSLGENITSDI